MRMIWMTFGLSASLIASSAVAQPGPPDNSGPKDMVAGRTYCSVLNILGLISNPDQTERVRSTVARRRVTFNEDGTWMSEPVSWVVNLQTDGGQIFEFDLTVEYFTSTYTQTGRKLLVAIPDDNAIATWFVSENGSVINGSWIRLRENPLNTDESWSQTVKWSLVEGDDCDPVDIK